MAYQDEHPAVIEEQRRRNGKTLRIIGFGIVALLLFMVFLMIEEYFKK